MWHKSFKSTANAASQNVHQEQGRETGGREGKWRVVDVAEQGRYTRNCG